MRGWASRSRSRSPCPSRSLSCDRRIHEKPKPEPRVPKRVEAYSLQLVRKNIYIYICIIYIYVLYIYMYYIYIYMLGGFYSLHVGKRSTGALLCPGGSLKPSRKPSLSKPVESSRNQTYGYERPSLRMHTVQLDAETRNKLLKALADQEPFALAVQFESFEVVRGGPEVRFHQSSTRVLRGSARAARWCDH